MSVFGRRVVALELLLAASGLALPVVAWAQDEKASGERPAAAAASGRDAFPVAVLRLDKVFKDNAEFQGRMKLLKAELEELEKTIQIRQAEIETTQAKLTRVPQGTTEFEKLQLQLARLRTELIQFVNREKESALNREAQVYRAYYSDLEEVVAAYCKQRGIRLVLRQVDGAEGANPTRQAVLAAVNRDVIYADNLDITEDIVRLLAERQRQEQP
jgi:Skp family chaperone for outer membrane proteins